MFGHRRISSHLLRFLLVALVLVQAVIAQQPAAQPILRLETGMHTAVIRRIGVDAAGRFLVTASDDKTIRVWDIATGELLRVLRPPLSAGNEGKLYSVAISPDGNTIAVGGYTSNEQGNSESIYLFDRATGQIARRLGKLPNVVNHLVFSPDGKRLAAMFGGKNGVRVYETGGWQQIGADADYYNQGYGADFDRSGRLVTSCDDGFIRLYAVGATGLRLLAKKTTSGGKEPASVKFSPDGSKIAVGFADSTAVSVLSGTDLSFLLAPDVSGVRNGNLISVAWSVTGDMLYSGGTYGIGNSPIRFWRDGGRGKFGEASASLITIFDIQPLPNGSVIYGAFDPAWGVIDASGKRTRFVTSGIPDYRGLLENFRVLNDGTEVGFGYELFGKWAARFSLVERRLELTANQKLNSSRTTANNLNITDWKDTREPKLNSSKLNLRQNERSRSLAITPDGLKFLLGTSFRIRLFDQTGKELWNVTTPGEAWSVNISGDGRLALAAYADGTIRWYRMTDGAELLAFFPHNDKKRWVLWTPTGYYDASSDAEGLIGWHVNNGKDAAADFFPVGLFRSQFYRPDIVSKILFTADEAKAVALANDEAGRKQAQTDVAKQLPPVVEILNPRDGTSVSSKTVKISYNLRTPSNEAVTSVKALVNGRPVSVARQLVREEIKSGAQEITVEIPEADCEIAIIAENRFAPSVPAIVRLKWSGEKPRATGVVKVGDEFVIRPKLYILAIGVSKYADANYNLGFAAKDAKDFAAAMQKQKSLLYRDIEIKILTDEIATRDNIVDSLDWITRATTSKDVAMVFFAGHGINDNLNRYYFAPHNYNPEKLASTGVTRDNFIDAIQSIAGKVVFFVDTCHAGNSIGTTVKRRDGAVDVNGFANELASAENGAIVFTASTGRQVSLEDAMWNNGAFTKALIEGLSGRAEVVGKGKITINSLDLYISERVKELTKGRQTPTTAKPDTVSDFPVAVRQ